MTTQLSDNDTLQRIREDLGLRRRLLRKKLTDHYMAEYKVRGYLNRPCRFCFPYKTENGELIILKYAFDTVLGMFPDAFVYECTCIQEFNEFIDKSVDEVNSVFVK